MAGAPPDPGQALVGVDLEGQDQVSPARSWSEWIQFVVWGDKQRLYLSQWVHSLDDPLRIDIELEGATELGLEVRGSGARWLLGSAAWGEARVVRAPGKAGGQP